MHRFVCTYWNYMHCVICLHWNLLWFIHQIKAKGFLSTICHSNPFRLTIIFARIVLGWLMQKCIQHWHQYLLLTIWHCRRYVCGDRLTWVSRNRKIMFGFCLTFAGIQIWYWNTQLVLGRMAFFFFRSMNGCAPWMRFHVIWCFLVGIEHSAACKIETKAKQKDRK